MSEIRFTVNLSFSRINLIDTLILVSNESRKIKTPENLNRLIKPIKKSILIQYDSRQFLQTNILTAHIPNLNQLDTLTVIDCVCNKSLIRQGRLINAVASSSLWRAAIRSLSFSSSLSRD